MCLGGGGKPTAGPTTTPAQKAPLAPVLPSEDPRTAGQGRRKLRIDLTQPQGGGLSGLKIPV